MTSLTGHRVGPRVELRFGRGKVTAVAAVAWHRKGDYLATNVPGLPTRNVSIHQVSKASSQAVIRKQLKCVTALRFHPNKPFFFVATKQHVRVYHLREQRMLKRLLTGCKHVSSMDVHPGGDHVLIGSYDRRVCWFDLDRGSVPYKVLKYHTKAVRGAVFHPLYPLMATAADDGTCQIFHATVYSDLNRDPYIVPLKVLSGVHSPGPHGLGILAIAFHPNQPWVFTAGADGKIALYCES